MQRKARDLAVGEVLRLPIYGEIVSVKSVVGGKRIKVRVALEDQGRRANRGALSSNLDTRKADLEFTNAGHEIEFICKPGHVFRLTEWWDDDDNDGEDEPELNPLLPESAD